MASSAACAQLHTALPLADRRGLGRLERLLSSLAHWCPLLGQVGELPPLVYPWLLAWRPLAWDPPHLVPGWWLPARPMRNGTMQIRAAPNCTAAAAAAGRTLVLHGNYGKTNNYLIAIRAVVT